MLLRYRDPQFWKTFHDRHWQPRVPTVLRQPFKDFPFTEDLLLRALQGFAAGIEDGDARKPCLVTVGEKETAPRRPLKNLFREKSESLEGLEKSCARVFPGKNTFGLMITQMQAVHPGIWNGLTSFLQDGREWLDLPVPRAFLDLFYGNYLSTFTGVHKDTQEIIAFVVRGKKRMLAWPFDYFQSRLDDVTAADRFFNKRLPIDPRKYRKDALVLDAQAGDVFYWPSDYWHVSEVQDGQFSAMLSMGLFRPEVKLSGESQTKRLVSQDMTKVAPRADGGQQLRWITSYGFEQGGPVAEGKQPAGKLVVVHNKSSVILWKIDATKRQLLVATNGHSITLPHSAKLVKLLERITQSETVSVTHDVSKESSPVSETYWNNQLELKTRKRSARRDTAASLVDWLLRVHAVIRNVR